MVETRIIEEVPLFRYRKWIQQDKISINPHASIRISDAQRNLFKDEELIHILKTETPILIGLQQNGRYSAFFKRKDRYLRIIFQLSENLKIEIGTFYNTRHLPQLRK